MKRRNGDVCLSRSKMILMPGFRSKNPPPSWLRHAASHPEWSLLLIGVMHWRMSICSAGFGTWLVGWWRPLLHWHGVLLEESARPYSDQFNPSTTTRVCSAWWRNSRNCGNRLERPQYRADWSSVSEKHTTNRRYYLGGNWEYPLRHNLRVEIYSHQESRS